MPVAFLHVVAEGWNWSAGQILLVPSHDSATSQTPEDALHCEVDFASDGHAALEPVHVSFKSQTPVAFLQTVVKG